VSRHPPTKERLMMTTPLSLATFAVLGLLLPVGSAESPAARTTRNVAVVLYEGVELLDFAGPSEAFAAAANIAAHDDQPAFHVYTVARSKAPLVSQGFVHITPEFSIDDAPRPD